MNTRPSYLWLYALIILCLTIGWLARGLLENSIEEKTLQGAMAWGYDETQNVWNRIRVNEHGHVICYKEGE